MWHEPSTVGMLLGFQDPLFPHSFARKHKPNTVRCSVGEGVDGTLEEKPPSIGRGDRYFVSQQQGKLFLSFRDTFTVREFPLAPAFKGFNAHVIVTPLNLLKFSSKAPSFSGTWVAQSVEHLALGFGTGHDLGIRDSALHLAQCLAGQSA